MPGSLQARWSRLVTAVALLASLPLANITAQEGTAIIEGRVTDAANNRPIENVQVSIDGTTLGGLTNAQGAYRIVGDTGSGRFALGRHSRSGHRLFA